MPQVARFWNAIADEFDSIYTGANKSVFSRFLDRYFRKDIYERFDWVMQKCADVRGKTICDIGCGSGRFVTEGSTFTLKGDGDELLRMGGVNLFCLLI